jgi:protein involved in polysaccharide export with SLBB domain
VVGILFLAAAAAQAQEVPRRNASQKATAPTTEAEKPWFIISGGVQKPGRFEMRGRVTALEALMLAGGLTAPAGIEELLILRRTERDEVDVLAIDLKHALRRGGRIDDLPLRSGDRLLVGEDARAIAASAKNSTKATRAGRLSHSLQ